MRAPAPTRRILLTTAIFGVGLSIVLRFGSGQGTDPLSRILTLAVLGVVPLALAVAPSSGSRWDALLRVIAWALPVAGLCAVASLWAPTGVIGGGWASAWMGLALLAAALGASRLLLTPGGLRDATAWTVGGALLYLPVGAGWLVMARMGLRPMGFDPMIVLLTAVHFHFAALAGPTLAARAAERLEGRPARVARLAGLVVVGSMPVVAVGITASPVVALVGAVSLTAALIGLAVVTLGWLIRRVERRAAKLLLGVSAISVLLSMPLAVVYAWGQVRGADPIGLEWMIRIHGYANAHGFVTCGLLAWALEDRAAR